MKSAITLVTEVKWWGWVGMMLWGGDRDRERQQPGKQPNKTVLSDGQIRERSPCATLGRKGAGEVRRSQFDGLPQACEGPQLARQGSPVPAARCENHSSGLETQHRAESCLTFGSYSSPGT